MVEARGLHSYKDSILGIGIKGRKEFREAAVIHESGEGKELISRSIKGIGGKGVFGNINADKDAFHSFFTSFLMVLRLKGRRCASRPILHNDKGLKGPTNLSWIREAGNKLSIRLYGLGKMKFSCHVLILIINSVFYCSKYKNNIIHSRRERYEE